MAEKPRAEPEPEAEEVAYEPGDVRNFCLGNITLGELEGIDKDAQMEIAERGFTLVTEGQLDEAEQVFRGLIALDPYDAYFHTVLGSVYQRKGLNDAAIEEYGRALKTNPYNTSALANRGELYFMKGKLAEATEDFKAAMEHDPEGKDPSTLRVRVLAAEVAKALAAAAPGPAPI